MAETPKKPITRPYFVDETVSINSANFPTFKVNVPAPTKSAATSPPEAQAPAPGVKPKGA
jgi:hypothetical protein